MDGSTEEGRRQDFEISAAVNAAPPAQTVPVAAPPESAAVALTAEQVRQIVGQAWLDALGPTATADNVSFFSAGGSSLSALRLVKLLRDAIPEPRFEIADLYNKPTMAGQVEFLTAEDSAPGPAPEPDWTSNLDDLLDAVSRGALSPQEAALSLDAASDR
jgi:hypothetical protein